MTSDSRPSPTPGNELDRLRRDIETQMQKAPPVSRPADKRSANAVAAEYLREHPDFHRRWKELQEGGEGEEFNRDWNEALGEHLRLSADQELAAETVLTKLRAAVQDCLLDRQPLGGQQVRQPWWRVSGNKALPANPPAPAPREAAPPENPATRSATGPCAGRRPATGRSRRRGRCTGHHGVR